MALKPTRRVVTGHDAQGKAVVLFDGTLAAKPRPGGGTTNLWVTTEFPVDVSASTDRAQVPVAVPPPANGGIFRIVEFAPETAHAAPVDHDKMLQGMGIDPATQGYQRHAHTHRTRSIDYALILEGEIDMLLDDSEVHVKAGDVVIQQGTNHAWVNKGAKPCRIAFILIDAKAPAAWRQGRTP